LSRLKNLPFGGFAACEVASPGLMAPRHEERTRSRPWESAIGDGAVRLLDWLSLAGWCLVSLIGWLQTRGISAGWLTSYGGDIFGPPVFWWGFRRTLFAKMRRGAELAALFVVVACFVWEFCQRYDLSGTPLSITRGVSDPLDLVCYALAVGVCYAVEKGLQRRHQSSVAAVGYRKSGAASPSGDDNHVI
jgi:hypothetical protein